MNDSPTESFVLELRGALHHLYDWAYLRRSPLVAAFGVNAEEDASAAVRHMLVGAIEALKPEANVPSKAKAWRLYHLLHARFTEQFTQIEVATELALSIRHLRREETVAIERLAAYLWRQHDLGTRWAQQGETPPSTAGDDALLGSGMPTAQQELEQLQTSRPPEPLDIGDIIEPVLRIAGPIAEEAGVRLECAPLEGAPQIVAQWATIRQAILTVLTTVIHRVPGGEVSLALRSTAGEVVVEIQGHGGAASRLQDDHEIERLEMARRLVSLSGASIDVVAGEEGGQPFGVKIALQAHEQMPVLVIEDNVDALRLIERYLSNSCYRFVGTSDPAQALPMAKDTSPRVIVLDVMLPEVDGWELLGRLHEHPGMRDVPIIVCTILPEAQLAAELGAAAFIRKPLSRQAPLQALDQQVGRPPRESW